MKTIWVISKYATPVRAPRLFELSKSLAKRGHLLTLFTSVSNHLNFDDVPTFTGLYQKEYHDDVSVYWMNGPVSSNRGLKRVVSWLLFEIQIILLNIFNSKQKPDVIISSSLSILSVWSGLLLSRRFKAKFIFEVRDIWPLSLLELSDYSDRNIFVKFLAFTERIGYRYADSIVGTMPNLKEHVRSFGQGWESKVSCVPQGINVEHIESEAEALDNFFSRHYLPPKEKIHIAYAGTLSANNPIEAILEAAVVLRDDERFHFSILGKGPNRNHYKEKYGNIENINFPPYLKKSQISAFLQTVDIGYDAFSSDLAKYGLSRNKWIDYMYNRCIVLCSYDGYQSMINESKSGYFVTYGSVQDIVDKLKEISEMDSIKRDEMKDRAREFILENRKFDTLSISYEQIINSCFAIEK